MRIGVFFHWDDDVIDLPVPSMIFELIDVDFFFGYIDILQWKPLTMELKKDFAKDAQANKKSSGSPVLQWVR